MGQCLHWTLDTFHSFPIKYKAKYFAPVFLGCSDVMFAESSTDLIWIRDISSCDSRSLSTKQHTAMPFISKTPIDQVADVPKN